MTEHAKRKAMKLSAKILYSLHGWPLLALLMLATPHMQAQNARYVDPMLGVDGGGNTFAGATLPFGMLKAGPDTGDNTANSGWTADGLVNGFSQTHVSGTGGGPKYGNILLQPTTGEITSSSGHGSPRANERASAGFYGVTLTRYKIGVEIASARRSAIYRFTYPASEKSNLLIDAGSCLSGGERQHENQTVVASSTRILSSTEISGFTTVLGGWNIQPIPYTVYFYAVTDTPAKSFGSWSSGALSPGSRGDSESKGRKSGAWLTFDTHSNQVVQMKIGISFVSEAQAKANATSEIPSFDFEAVHTQAQEIWNEALAPISIEGTSEDDLRQFYTALYHTMLMPVDRTGENPLFRSTEPSYDDFYAIWDTFRSSSPLLTLIAEKRESEIVRSLVDLYRHEGFLPDARSGNYNGRVQGGSDADMTIVDGYLKHLPGIDWQTAYKAVEHDAEATPSDPRKEGRGDLEDWRTLGYLSIEGSDRPASKSMEYAANDYAVALLAKGLRNDAAYRKYSARAANWKNLWDPGAADHGFTGFIWPRHRDGSWKPNFDPQLSGTWGSDSFYEGNSWTYSTFVPQDVAGLIRASGGSTLRPAHGRLLRSARPLRRRQRAQASSRPISTSGPAARTPPRLTSALSSPRTTTAARAAFPATTMREPCPRGTLLAN